MSHRNPDASASRDAGRDALAIVGRQAVYDGALRVVAYELLYRRSVRALSAEVTDARLATLRVIASAALEIGLDRLAGGFPVHINYPRELLVGEPLLPLNPERVIIEVLEDVPGDAEVLAAIAALRGRGHRIALDDYSPESCDPALLDVADIVKIVIAHLPPAELVRTVRELEGRGLTLIAEEVETLEQFERCIRLGFAGFQGHFLQHPQTFRAQRLPANRLATLRLLAQLQNEEYSVEEVERLVSQDVTLSYRVLRCINSSYYNLPRNVDSIRQGIVLLGLDNLRRLCTVVSLLGFDERPASLLVDAMIRARMCERLGRLGGTRDVGPHFITGLFSMLDTLLGVPAAEIVAELPLAVPVARALIAEEGELGEALHCARAYERGRWERVAYRDLTPEAIGAAYVDAVLWAEEEHARLSS